MSERRRPRLLLAVLVYNGQAFVPACLESVARLRDRSRTVDVDALVLDDASPEPGWSGELESLCEHLGLGYYCSPRNLGIPRNMNLALLRSLRAGHDYVLITNSLGLKISGITRDTPNPPRGEIVHGRDGEPNGILKNAEALLKGLDRNASTASTGAC